jgi:SpoVK/Ycf46/Vps4 family AAA+-type ATPase
MRISSTLDGLLVLLDQVKQESKINRVASADLKKIYTTCITDIRDKVYALRHTRVLDKDNPLGWDELLPTLTSIFAPVFKYNKDKVSIPERKMTDFSVLIESLRTKMDEIPKKALEYFKTLTEFSDNLQPLEFPAMYSFDSLVGNEREKQALVEGFLDPFLLPQLYPKKASGALLYGPPGTGKSLIIRAMVNEFKGVAYLFAPTVDSLRGSYEGQTQQKIMAVYDTASNFLDYGVPKKEIAFIVIDEAEGLLGQGRGDMDASKERSVTPFLQAMDSVKSDPRIVTILLTNHPDIIDSAVLRRLPLRIRFDLPDPTHVKILLLRTIKERYLEWTKKIVRIQDEDKQLFSNLRLFGHSTQYLKESDVDEMVKVLVKEKYSPSDIDKGMVQVFNKASTRALEAARKGARFLGPLGGYRSVLLHTLVLAKDTAQGTRTIETVQSNGNELSYEQLDAVFDTLPYLIMPTDDPARKPIAKQIITLGGSNGTTYVPPENLWSTMDFRLVDFQSVFTHDVFKPSITPYMIQAINDFESKG